MSQGPIYSPDGRWYWDGTRWQPVPTPPGWALPPYRSPRLLGQWTVGLLVATTCAIGVWMLVYLFDLAAQSSPHGDPQAGSALVALGELLVIAVGVPTAVVFAVWLYRCARNVRAFGAQQLRWPPAMAFVSWIIPYANIYFPFAVVREVWLASDPRTPLSTRLTRRGVAPLPLFWWIAFYLGLNLLGLAIILRLDAHDRGSAVGLDVFGVVSCLLTAGSAGPAIALVLQMNRRQEQRGSMPSP